MERGEEIRLEALRALTILAVHDEEFRREYWNRLRDCRDQRASTNQVFNAE